MAESTTKPAGPDFRRGVPMRDIPAEGTISGHVDDTPVFLSRFGDELFAVSAVCTHYGAALTDGLVSGSSARCPWHHACFSLKTGEALSAPAIDSLDRWSVKVENDIAFVQERLTVPKPTSGRRPAKAALNRVVIVGGGAAGFAAAEMLRRKGFDGDVTILSAEAALPCDRPNLSKDYLAGKAPEEWLWLKNEEFYRERMIDMKVGTQAIAIDPHRREVQTSRGDLLSYDAVLLATGAEPIRPAVAGFTRDNVFALRSVSDANAIRAAAARAKTVVIAGASFIGLEAAASLRTLGLDVHVVAPERLPMERTLGPELGTRILQIHEKNGVRFHLGRMVEGFDGTHVLMSDGGKLGSDMVVLGIGVRPNIMLARDAGLEVEIGVIVDAHMQTSRPGIFAAGDIANYPDVSSGARLRIEHWVVAQRQGQVAAQNILGEDVAYRSVPFFWSNHYDLAIRYVGHAAKWDRIEVAGSVADDDCTVRYILANRVIAAASIGRDRESLEIEMALQEGAARRKEAVTQDGDASVQRTVCSAS